MNYFKASRVLAGLIVAVFLFATNTSNAQDTRLLRQPNISDTQVVFAYGSDIWVADRNGGKAIRVTSTPAVEKDPYFSPDGQWIAFTSNRTGADAVFLVSSNGGDAKQLTWHPSSSRVRGWTNDGKRILFASNRDAAPTNYDRLWTVSISGGPAALITEQWGTSGSYSPNGKQLVLDKMRRWDVEWRAYRGGQNTPLIVMDLNSQKETLIPNDKTTDVQPIWMDDMIYFLSDRDFTMNIWSYNPKSAELNQVTKYQGSDIKSLSGRNGVLVFERDGFIHELTLSDGSVKRPSFTVVGDFPWANTDWKDVSRSARLGMISPTGKRVIVESRGDVFTVPIENGDSRNITKTSGVADRAPIWSPKGDKIAWFSDSKNGYSLIIAAQDGSSRKTIGIGESKLAWEPTWSPDGKYIAFTDDDVRIQVIDTESGALHTADIGGNNLERGRLGLTWSPDSKWLAYSKSTTNNFRQIVLWSVTDRNPIAITDRFADSFSPSWDRDKKHMYFLASTDVALGSGWANTSAMTSRPVYAAYVINLSDEDSSPFKPKSDEEESKKKEDKSADKKEDKKEETGMRIDFDGIDRRILALSIPARNYSFILSGPAGFAFIGERIPNSRGLTLHKYDLKKLESKEFTSGVNGLDISADGKQMLLNSGMGWKITKTAGPNAKGAKPVKMKLEMKIDKSQEWNQIFEEAWRYERDYFYDPNMHGRDWNTVYERYAPLVPFVKHRADLNYILDQVNGELSVGHSFVRGGDYPEVGRSKVGLLGVDLVKHNNRWRIDRIYTTESWNPRLYSPLDQPGLDVSEGDYIVGINGREMLDSDNPYEFLDGTRDMQTNLHVNKKASFEGSHEVVVKPIGSENGLRQRAWVEDNRRMVDELSGGKLGYIWVPNTGGGGFVSFNRYYFAQQDKLGAVIDERFNGGGLLDDYMVDLMTRSLRAGLTNEVPNGKAMRLPAGILGPKALLINELAGSGGDFFPWVFRQQNAGPLIGATTWGGLVKSSTHYRMIDGGSLTAPDNAVFDPINNEWVAENKGVAPDIFVRQDAVALSKGRDPQLERAVKEVLALLEKQRSSKVVPPPFSTPAKRN